MFEELKDEIRNALTPAARRITEINPNTITLSGLFLSFISAFLFAMNDLFWAGLLLLASGFLDAFDGLVARENNRITGFGGFLDSVCDRFGDTAVLIGAMYGGLTAFYFIPFWLAGTLAIFSSLMVSYTRARAEAAGISASIGIGDRPVRMIIIIAGAFFNVVNWAVMLISVFSFITIYQRIKHVKRVLR